MLEEEDWPLKRNGRESFVAKFVGVEGYGNHPWFFMEAVDMMPVAIEANGYEKKLSTYHPGNIETVMKYISEVEDSRIEMPHENWDMYKSAMRQALSGINELTGDEFRELSKGHTYRKYSGPDFGEDDFEDIIERLEQRR